MSQLLCKLGLHRKQYTPPCGLYCPHKDVWECLRCDMAGIDCAHARDWGRDWQ